jgi:hypothetical protein
MSYLPVQRTNNAAVDRRQTGRELEQVRGDALVKAARTEAIGFVATVGLHQVAGLTALESDLLKSHPLGEARFQGIVDTATTAIAAEVAGMVYRR